MEDKQMKVNKNQLQPAQFYEALKKRGHAFEQQINGTVQNLFNNDNLVRIASENTDLIANNIHSLQNYVEVLSTILLFPTKNDVANVAKLVLQTEEKVDKLEEHVFFLRESLARIVNQFDKKGDDPIFNKLREGETDKKNKSKKSKKRK